MVIVLAIGPKARGFKPGRERWIFKGEWKYSRLSRVVRFNGMLKIPLGII
jgi:hypothetical protein